MNRFDVIGFGALNVDKLYKVNRIAGPDEEGFITDFEEAGGGSAANAIVGLRRLGCKVGFVGKIGDDRDGKLLIDDFRKEGVDTKSITIAGKGRTGTVMDFIDKQGMRALYVDSGANDTIQLEEIQNEYVHQTAFLHITSFVGEQSFQTQKKLVQNLPENAKVSMDPGEIYAVKGLAALEPLLHKTFVFLPSARELQILTGKANYEKNAEAMIDKGVRIVAVKLGSEGCYVTDGRENYHVEPFKVKVVDTTGAGDAFCAGFIYGLLRDKNVCDCGRLGNFVASRCIMKMGARAGLPKLTDLAKSNLL